MIWTVSNPASYVILERYDIHKVHDCICTMILHATASDMYGVFWYLVCVLVRGVVLRENVDLRVQDKVLAWLSEACGLIAHF